MHQFQADLLGIVVQVDVVDLGPRSHNRANLPLCQLQHAADHHPLTTIEHRFVAFAFQHVGDFFIDITGFQPAAAQQAHHRMGSTLAARQVAVGRLLAALAGNLVEHFDENREADRRIQIAFGDMETQAFCGQAETDHHQKAQTQHDHCRTTIDELGQRLAGDHHQANGEDHRDHHHRQVLDHAHRRNNGVQREHRVKHDDLRHDRPEQCIACVAGTLGDMAFQPLVQFHGGLEQQEHTTEQHDQVTSGKGLVENLEQRLGQRDHPGDARQQAEAHDQCQRQANDPCFITLLRGQLVRQDGDENQVVDTQHQLQHDEGQQAKPCRGVSDPFHGSYSVSREKWQGAALVNVDQAL
ncbi:Uncharacterized protein ALO94_05560 [Pseudomonas syringae pv. spinaceae]|uniref:Uncharacterized protein n=1 Tax=Pseudomonas syringae pv. spinaceae TaxID=264459 RepID=A0A0Q0I3P2_PSESX|nr:Uncharacterized protein ALO94_05560 [Pseudomonas syringae pv. spinaceae]